MRIPKKVRELPWPEPFTGIDRMHFRVTVQQPVADGERLLVVTFTMNGARRNAMRWTSASGKDLRLVCSKKHRTAAILTRGDRACRRVSLTGAKLETGSLISHVKLSAAPSYSILKR